MDSSYIMNFSYENSPVRVTEINGETWWILKDVCEILGLSNTNRTAARLEDDELTLLKLMSGGQNREMIAVNESGLYSVILRSDKPESRTFRRWVTHEVLPEIRRTGGYNVMQSDILEDSELTPVAKTIYMYLCHYARGRKEFTINRRKIMEDLQMGNYMYTTHFRILKESGYISTGISKSGTGRILGIKVRINSYNERIANTPESFVYGGESND